MLVAPALERAGVRLLDVSWHPNQKPRVLRLTVDRQGGITIDDCGRASEAASRVLDRHEELVPGSYSLEVTSPGAERPLLSASDYLAALGRRVRLTLEQGEGQTVVEGKLVKLGDDQLELEARRSRSGRLVSITVSRSEVVAGKVVVAL